MAKLATKKGFLTFSTVLAVLGLIGWGLLSWFAPTAMSATSWKLPYRSTANR
jgi:hypothetical protein